MDADRGSHTASVAHIRGLSRQRTPHFIDSKWLLTLTEA